MGLLGAMVGVYVGRVGIKVGGTDGRHSVRGQPSNAPAPTTVLVRLSHRRHTRLVQLLNADMPIDFTKPLM